MATRSPICVIEGHVDHGKTSILDQIRGTSVVSGEAGKITQMIGASIIPLETIKKVCGNLLETLKLDFTIPGLLLIDTPGHAAFSNLRKRGGALADIAILVVDINEGFKPQTIEAIEILKSDKTPFIVAANKVDLISGWQADEKKTLMENINGLPTAVSGEFEKKIYEVVGKLHDFGFPAERFDRVDDYTKQIAIVPTSGLTGQGIPELLMVLSGLAQRFLEEKLEVEVEGKAKGTVLEVKEEKGLGVTLDVIIYDGGLKVNDTIVIGGIGEAIATKVRSLLEPMPLMEMREKKAKFKRVNEVFAATGVKISAPNLNEAIAGMPIRSCDVSEVEKVKEELQQEVEAVLIETEKEGIVVKADSLGSLEALIVMLKEKGVLISFASIGNITKKDISKAESGSDIFNKMILGFNVKMTADAEKFLKEKDVKVITHEVIYQIIDSYSERVEELKKEIEMRELGKLVRPCKFFVLKGYTFRQNNPAIVGVEIEVGKIKTGDAVMNKEGKAITTVKSLEAEGDNLSVAEQGKQLAMSLDGVTVGRQIKEGEFYYSDIPGEDFKKLKELKQYLSEKEIMVLKEIAEIKRRTDPVWGVG
ncbi:translation initiation factor IF-2 [Candidatus Woesearchaeota archaeon]|nr:translation initiation factor IF-2 [Candidatus Woesearchaeota archaeon]